MKFYLATICSSLTRSLPILTHSSNCVHKKVTIGVNKLVEIIPIGDTEQLETLEIFNNFLTKIFNKLCTQKLRQKREGKTPEHYSHDFTNSDI